MTTPTESEQRLLRLPQVIERTGLQRSSLYDLIRSNRFPQPVKLARLSAWPEAEVAAWIAARIAARDAGGAI